MYYYFYEGTKGTIIRSRSSSQAPSLSTLESMVAGLVAGLQLLFVVPVSLFLSEGEFFLGQALQRLLSLTQSG